LLKNIGNWLKIFFGFLFLGGLLATPALALEIQDLTLGTHQGYLVCSWRLVDVPFAKLDEALHHGIPFELRFFIELEKIQRFRRDKKILRHEVVREVYYNAIKNLYQVYFVGLPYPPRNVTSLEEALALAGDIKALPLLPLTSLERGKSYRLKVKVIIYQKVSPGLTSRVLRFLFRGGKIESDWVYVRFKLPE